MRLSGFKTMDPNLLLGLINTALRNDCGDLDDLAKQHDVDEQSLVTHMSSLGYTYRNDINQFRPQQAEA